MNSEVHSNNHQTLPIKYLPNYNREWGNIAYANPGDAGFDLRAALDSPVTLRPGETLIIPTGICVAVPLNFELQIRPRSGLAAKNKITIVNTPGTIDSGYRGEIKIILRNENYYFNDRKYDIFHPLPEDSFISFVVNPGDRIAQAVLCPIFVAMFDEVADLDDTVRGTGGLGSSGTK